MPSIRDLRASLPLAIVFGLAVVFILYPSYRDNRLMQWTTDDSAFEADFAHLSSLRVGVVETTSHHDGT